MASVVYDMVNMTAAMPAQQLLRLDEQCSALATHDMTVSDAQSLVGVMTWAAACIPQAHTFVAAIRHACATARASKAKFIKRSQRVRADATWWVAAVRSGLASNGVAVLPVQQAPAVVIAGDAGSEWGMGAHGGGCYYKVRTPAHVIPM